MQLKGKKTKYNFCQGNTYILLSSFRSSHCPLPIIHQTPKMIKKKKRQKEAMRRRRRKTVPSASLERDPNIQTPVLSKIIRKKEPKIPIPSLLVHRICAVEGVSPVVRHMSSSVTMNQNKNNVRRRDLIYERLSRDVEVLTKKGCRKTCVQEMSKRGVPGREPLSIAVEDCRHLIAPLGARLLPRTMAGWCCGPLASVRHLGRSAPVSGWTGTLHWSQSRRRRRRRPPCGRCQIWRKKRRVCG